MGLAQAKFFSKILARSPLIPALLLVLGGLFFCYFSTSFRPAAERDPDRYYHFAISQRIAQAKAFSGVQILRTLPEVEDLGWALKFPEKEFLFHELTAGAYRIGGESGIEVMVGLLGFSILMVLVWTCASYVDLASAILCVFSLTLFEGLWLLRATLIRPHVLAVLSFTLLLAALLKRSPWIAVLSGALFSLGYHAIYLPGALLILALGSSWFVKRDRVLTFVALMGCLGLVLGVFVNPYFPMNFEMGLLHLKIALHLVAIPTSNWGAELVAYKWTQYLILFHFPLLLLLICLKKTMEQKGSIDQLWVGAGCLLFWLATALSPRAMEYSFPLSAVFLAMSLRESPFTLKVSTGLALFSFLTQGLLFGLPQVTLNQGQYAARAPEFQAVLQSVSPASTQKVFNCTWDISPFVMYFRPRLRVVDVLDPSFLYEVSPEKYDAREKILSARDLDIHGIVRKTFQADYFLCNHENLFQLLSSQSQFKLLSRVGKTYLFEVSP